MRKIAIILLSGGLDSTTVASYAVKQGYETTALTFDYGQKHKREIESAEKVAHVLGIPWELLDFSSYKKLAWYSALTQPGSFDVPQNRIRPEISQAIPITYVPLRNTFFITMAAAFLESRVLSLIESGKINPPEIEASLFIAVNAIDYSGYPDCRPEFYRKISDVLHEGSKLGSQYGIPININTPIIAMSKSDIVRLAFELEAPLDYTWSCYEGGEVPCNICDSCLLRAAGFAGAGRLDPLILRLQKEGKIAPGKQIS